MNCKHRIWFASSESLDLGEEYSSSSPDPGRGKTIFKPVLKHSTAGLCVLDGCVLGRTGSALSMEFGLRWIGLSTRVDTSVGVSDSVRSTASPASADSFGYYSSLSSDPD